MQIRKSVLAFVWVGTLIIAFCVGINYEKKESKIALANASVLIGDICKWVMLEDNYFGGWPMICKDLKGQGHLDGH
tara:strand:- start:4161 stop:4388 length:228 start_codon:yes stop_codon:yes gene_type:complete